MPADENGVYCVDFREHPEYYRIDRGEQGVFKVEPYKSELLPLWGYADAGTAAESAVAIRERFEEYRERGEFVGMDMARKYLRMGYTRAMRYARYPGGRKYVDGEERDPVEWADAEKRRAARIYWHALQSVTADSVYRAFRERWPRV
ncbi:DUF4385 family protein [Salarchaeum japonicum]|uniref:DUF4385 family protein n=1 Tax=Salarchaeum japonicum TaxID=555573 RepID=UPI0031D0F444